MQLHEQEQNVLSLQQTEDGVFNVVTDDAPNAEPRVIAGDAGVDVMMTPFGQGGRPETARVTGRLVNQHLLRRPRGYITHKRFVVPENGRPPKCSTHYSFWHNDPANLRLPNPLALILGPRTQVRAFALSESGQAALRASNEHIRTPVIWTTTVRTAMGFISNRSVSEIADGGVWRPPP
jgi:hypothetical protein